MLCKRFIFVSFSQIETAQRIPGYVWTRKAQQNVFGYTNESGRIRVPDVYNNLILSYNIIKPIQFTLTSYLHDRLSNRNWNSISKYKNKSFLARPSASGVSWETACSENISRQ